MIPVLDTLAGVLLATVGVLRWRRFRTSSLYAIGAAAAWFAAPLVPSLVLLHRPLLLHAILALPRRRVRGFFPWALLGSAWIAVLLPAGVQAWISLTTATLCLVVAAQSSG